MTQGTYGICADTATTCYKCGMPNDCCVTAEFNGGTNHSIEIPQCSPPQNYTTDPSITAITDIKCIFTPPPPPVPVAAPHEHEEKDGFFMSLFWGILTLIGMSLGACFIGFCLTTVFCFVATHQFIMPDMEMVKDVYRYVKKEELEFVEDLNEYAHGEDPNLGHTHHHHDNDLKNHKLCHPSDEE